VGIGCLNGTCYGTLFLPSSEVALYSYPGAFITTFTGINSSGMISGYWGDGLEALHAFIVAATISED